MKKKVLAGMLILVFILGLAGCQKKTPVNNPDTEADQQEEPVKEPDKDEESDLPEVTMGVCRTVDVLPLFTMQTQELDFEQGFGLTIIQYDTFEELNTAFQNNELDGMLTDSATVMASQGQERKLSIIGPADGEVSLLAGADAGVRELSQCNGKMVCMPEDTGMEYILDYLLAQNNYVDTYVDKSKADSYETVLSILSEEPDMLVLLPEPYAAMAKQQGAVELTNTKTYGLMPFVTAFGKDFLEEKADLARAFSMAYQQAVTTLATQDRQEKLSLFSANTGLSEEAITDMELPEYRMSQIPSEEELEDVYYWCLSRELYTGEFNRNDMVYDPGE